MSLPALHVGADIRSITERVNVLIRDYNQYGLRGLLTTRGDLLVRGAGDVARLPLGAAGTILTSDGTDALWSGLPTLTNSLAANVALNNTANYFTGPQVAQGTSGTWLVMGSICANNPTNASNYFAKLWDGTTVIDSGVNRTTIAGEVTTLSFAGVISNPVGNLRISVRDGNQTTGAILFNVTGTAKDSTLTAVRIG